MITSSDHILKPKINKLKVRRRRGISPKIPCSLPLNNQTSWISA